MLRIAFCYIDAFCFEVQLILLSQDLLRIIEVQWQATKDCVAKTLKRLEEKIHGRVSFFAAMFCNSHSSILISHHDTFKCWIPMKLNVTMSMLQVLKHLLYLMRVGEKAVQRRVALALAHLCSLEDQRSIFIDNNGAISCLCSFSEP